MSDFSWAACPDWWEKLQPGVTPIPTIDLDENLGDIAVVLFDKLVVPDIDGQPTMAEVPRRDIVRACFGGVDAETGARIVSEVFCLGAKKNTNTTLAACLGLIVLQLNVRLNFRGTLSRRGRLSVVWGICGSEGMRILLHAKNIDAN